MTLAALGIPEVLGYAKIAGMPVVTGLNMDAGEVWRPGRSRIHPPDG